MKWTKAYRRSAGKEMRNDTTFDFEKRRNRPVKYDREMMTKTLVTMKKVRENQRGLKCQAAIASFQVFIN